MAAAAAAAINAALPDSVELANDGFSTHPVLCRSEAVRLIGEAVSAVDFYGMADDVIANGRLC